MDKKEIIFWKNKYNQEEDLFNKELEERLGEKFRENNQVTKSDLIKIIKWKFQGRLLGRQKIILSLLNTVNDSFIKEVSKLVFKTQNNEERLKLFFLLKE